MNEKPDTVHGRLLESVHISGYSFERASQKFEWLLEDDRWKNISPGYDDIDKFIATIDFSEFKISIEKRKKISKKLADLRATQRASAKMLGVGAGTIARDVAPSGAKPEKESAPVKDVEVDIAPNGAKPPSSQSGAAVAKMAAKKEEKTEKQKEREETRKKEAKEFVGNKNKIGERWTAELGDIRDYQTDKTFDFIITDPPYPRDYLELFEALAIRSKEWLKPSGLLVVMCGESYLDQIYSDLSKHLVYYWTACYLTPGQPTPLRHRQVNTTWKPILIYALSDQYKGKIFGDVFKSDGNDKSYHEWGQSESGMLSLIQQICQPGQSIFDPFMGAGTTGLAALKHGCIFQGIDINEDNVNITTKRLIEYDAKEK